MILIALLVKQFWTVNTYENIALRRLAWQRYPFSGTPWAATLAVDGRQSDFSSLGGQCAISANSQLEAEWWVDLGGVRNLHHVVIQYRTDNRVWGCLTLGYYGENCSTPCPDNCERRDCDIVDGTCITCVPGYKGPMCNKACEGEYGMNCNKVCGACYQKEQCDYENGTCPNGCEDGYKGSQCTTVCNDNTYGPNCSMTCGSCLYLYGEKCNHVTGQCPRGCSSSFQGDLCIESRDEFKNKTTIAWSMNNAYDPTVSQTTPVVQTSVQVPFYSIITVVVLFSGSAILNLIFVSRQAVLRCRNREEKVVESVEKSSTCVDSIHFQNDGFSAHQELEQFYNNENDEIYTIVE